MTPSLADRYGLHRVVDPPGSFPQPAWRLDASPVCGPAEVLIDVERLNLDAASFRQLREAAGGDEAVVRTAIAGIVAERGKMHNPVTGSGGMLVGRVREVGRALDGLAGCEPGRRIATLVSLTLTPLRLEHVGRIDMQHGQVDVAGTAVLFAASPFAPLPDDLDERVALAALDVAGAPARTAALVAPGDAVLVIGAGTSGLLALHEARKHTGPAGVVVAADRSEAALRDVAEARLADAAVPADATDPVAFCEAVLPALGREADVTVNVVDAPGTELASVLATRDTGTVLLFSMATSFTAAALGAEGLGRATTLVIGNGHMPDRGATALAALRENPSLLAVFRRRYLPAEAPA